MLAVTLSLPSRVAWCHGWTKFEQRLPGFDRLEMVDQDFKPDNVMADVHGTMKIIDLGATRVVETAAIATPIEQQNPLGVAL